MNRQKKYKCLVYMNKKHPEGMVLVWTGNKSAAQICVQHDIPVGAVFSTGQIAFDEKKGGWQVSLEPLLASGCRLEKDEKLVRLYIERLEKMQERTMDTALAQKGRV